MVSDTELLSMTASAEDKIDYANLDPKVVIKGINKFLKDPTAKEAKGYASIIVSFAQESDDIYLKISMDRQPWLLVDGLPDKVTLLTAAYIGGNVKKQLEMGKEIDSPKEGFAAALVVYKALRSKKQLPKIDEMEKWSKLTMDQIWQRVEAAEKK